MPDPASSRPAHLIHALDTTPAPLSERQAVALAAEHFGLAATATRLSSERDQNFRMDDAAGRRFVLKIASPAEAPEVTNLQTMALLHVAKADPGLPVPRVFPARNGAAELALAVDDGPARIVRLLSYLPGLPLHQAPASLALCRDLGRRAAQLDLALRNFHHPAARHPLLWDLQHAGQLRPLLDEIGDLNAEDYRLLAGALDGFVSRIAPVLPRLRQQLVHNDLNPNNVMVDPSDHARVAGILDFGDMTQTALINDVAIAATYQVGSGEAALEPAAALVAGYHAVAPLQDIELDILFDLIVARSVMTVVIGGWRAARYPANRDYILRHAPGAWSRLRHLTQRPAERARAELRRACNME
ncbi:phosphotransferase [Ferrovibrio sp.]|uniref:phosphotransferase n=1 Tax=Ferrovibrio sp. TaxID=1917215 RepID=UPI00262E8ED6|nr:phosphotransferase [Ferrovibrio sp.]